MQSRFRMPCHSSFPPWLVLASRAIVASRKQTSFFPYLGTAPHRASGAVPSFEKATRVNGLYNAATVSHTMTFGFRPGLLLTF